mmetsp:Transcript_5183/g.12406  ORF Transcript_5183/g.12406 Transcript_5183/m.12406 type:complete len:91 (+) Transcript_5183:310-582(+)
MNAATTTQSAYTMAEWRTGRKNFCRIEECAYSGIRPQVGDSLIGCSKSRQVSTMHRGWVLPLGCFASEENLTLTPRELLSILWSRTDWQI